MALLKPLPLDWQKRALQALEEEDLAGIKREIASLSRLMQSGCHGRDALREGPARLIQALGERTPRAREALSPDDAHTLDEYISRLSTLAEVAFIRGEAMHAQEHPVVKAARAYMEEHLAHDIAQSDLAELLGFNPRYFGKLFRDHTGRTFAEYLNELRLESACRLLSETQLSVSEICERTGYNSASYFNRVFRKSYGQSPLDYRHLDRTQRIRAEVKGACHRPVCVHIPINAKQEGGVAL